MIKRLETKVSLAELSVEFMQNRLQNEHKEAIADLVIAHQGNIRDLKYYHATNLAEEKKKLRQQLNRRSCNCNELQANLVMIKHCCILS